MKKIIIKLILMFLILSAGAYAESNFGAPVPGGGEVVASDDSSVVNILYKNLTLKEIEDFYKEKLDDKKNIKWTDADENSNTVIYDWGNRNWHKIELADKGSQEGALVMIMEDNWTWIIGTLVIRFVGVFVVLLILMIALYVSGKIISKSMAKLQKAEVKTESES